MDFVTVIWIVELIKGAVLLNKMNLNVDMVSLHQAASATTCFTTD
jgi:hypothetical protein